MLVCKAGRQGYGHDLRVMGAPSWAQGTGQPVLSSQAMLLLHESVRRPGYMQEHVMFSYTLEDDGTNTLW